MSDRELLRRVTVFQERVAYIILELVPDHAQSLRHIELREWYSPDLVNWNMTELRK